MIEKIKQQKKGEAEQNYLIVTKSLEVSMGVAEKSLNAAEEIIKEVKSHFTRAKNIFGGMNNKMDGVIEGVKGNKETAEVAFIGGMKDAIDEMNNAGKKWIDDMKEKVNDGMKKVDKFLEEFEKKQEEMMDMLGKLTGDAQKKAEKILNDIKETQKQIMKEMQNASEEGKKHLTEELERVKKLQDEMAEEMKKMAESTDKKVKDAANEAINNAEKELKKIREKLEK